MNMTLGALSVLASVVLTSFAPDTAGAQQTKSRSIESRATQSRGGGADARIKTDEGPNRKGAAIAAPASKGGAKTRGAATGQLHVDNRTDLYIRIYADGNYAGTIGPWGDLYFNGNCDTWELYGTARFDDGSISTFGPVNTSRGCGSSKWTLRR